MQTRVVGLYYRPAAARVAVEELSPGDTLRLEPDPDNKFDEYAIKVFSGDIHIGYIPSRLAAYLDPPPTEGTFIKLEQERKNLYPVIELP